MQTLAVVRDVCGRVEPSAVGLHEASAVFDAFALMTGGGRCRLLDERRA